MRNSNFFLVRITRRAKIKSVMPVKTGIQEGGAVENEWHTGFRRSPE
jgi:hypothetical protein